MKKIQFISLLVLLLFVAMMIPVSAERAPRLTDAAGLLSESEQAELISTLDRISEKHQVDVVVVTVDSLGEMTPAECAEYFYDNFGYGFGSEKSGVLLLISMEERDWYITSVGFGITAVNKAGREYISDNMLEYLSDGYYAKAFEEFALSCDYLISLAETGDPFDYDDFPKEPFGVLKHLIISVIIGLVVAFIATGSMKGKLKSVRRQTAANNYVKNDSMKVTQSRDLFLYRQVSRTERPRDEDSGSSDTHTSASGQTHSGGGGKF